MKGVAVGATLNETASLLKEIGCEGAINLDGAGYRDWETDRKSVV